MRCRLCLAILALAYLLLCAACIGGRLSPAARDGLVAADRAACEVLVTVFAGATEAGEVCPAEEALVSGILSSLSAPAPASTAAPAIGATGGGAANENRNEHIAIMRGGRFVGRIRGRATAAKVQERIDAIDRGR